MRHETIIESTKAELRLTEQQALTLRRLGRQLASDTRWWGASDEPQESRSVIRCEHASSGLYTVTVRDAIGVVGLGDVQISVQPKIPLAHFLFLVGESETVPRSSLERSHLEGDETFSSLIAQWFVGECEAVLRRELSHDYHGVVADGPMAKGRIDCVRTTQALLGGRVKVRCSFDVHGRDTPLNRLLRHALRAVQWESSFPNETRTRARRSQARFDGVGKFQPSDFAAAVDSRTRHYRGAVDLARMLLTGRGVSTLAGPNTAGTFLFRTPEAVEEGVRRFLAEALAPDWHVDKKGRRLPGARPRTLNADLVFNGNEAIGDVKYRLTSGPISRSHLNQVTTFATGYGTTKGLLIGFGTRQDRDYVEVGPIRIDAMNWNVQHADPTESAAELAKAVRGWLLASTA